MHFGEMEFAGLWQFSRRWQRLFVQLRPAVSTQSHYKQCGESGYGAGLCFSVRTCSGTNSGFYLCANGCVIASLTYNQPPNGARRTPPAILEVDWNYYTGMTVWLDCQTIFTNVVTPGFMPEGGDVFVWGARSNTNTEEVRLDNIVIVTGGNLVQLPTSNPYFTDLNLPIETGYPITNALMGKLRS